MPLFSYCNESEEEELEMIAEFWMSDTRKQVFLGIQLRTSTSETSFSMPEGNARELYEYLKDRFEPTMKG